MGPCIKFDLIGAWRFVRSQHYHIDGRRITKYMRQLLAAILLCGAFGNAAASFVSAQPMGQGGVVVYLLGHIETGDLDKLQSRFRTVQKQLTGYKGSPVENFLYLNSAGGDLREALAIGRWVRATGMTVVVMPAERCYSSCVYILASGLYRHVAGKIGIHRPYLVTTPSGGIDATMKSALRNSQDYFLSMNIPTQLADVMFSIPPDKLEILDETSLSLYRLNQTDLVQQESVDLKNAAYYGLSRQEYMRRNQRYGSEREKCEHLSGLPKYQCWEQAKERAGLVRPIRKSAGTAGET